MHYHFIAIGGSAMHNLAIALHKKGETITGSDDEIFEPSRSRLANYGLLPEQTGWFPEKINSGIDAIVLGMHAKADNPELLRAQELELTIYYTIKPSIKHGLLLVAAVEKQQLLLW